MATQEVHDMAQGVGTTAYNSMIAVYDLAYSQGMLEAARIAGEMGGVLTGNRDIAAAILAAVKARNGGSK